MTEEYINKGLVEQLDAEIEYVDPTEGPFTLEDLEINKKDIEAFLKRQKDAPKGLVSSTLTDIANPFFTQYGEPKTLTGLATKSSLEAIKDQLINQAIRIEEQKKIAKKTSKAPGYLSLMSPRSVINQANNITKGFIEPVGMREGPATPVDKKTDPKTLVGPIEYLDYLKSVTPFTDEIQKVRYTKGSLLSMMPAAEITVGAPGGSIASGFNLRGLASFGDEILTQKVIAKAKKMSTKQGAEFIDEFIKSKNIDVNKLPQTDKVAKTIDNRTNFQRDRLFINMGDEGALLEYEDIGANLNEYMIRDDRNALLQAFNSPNYDMYNEVLQANLKKAFPSGKINVERVENYVEGGEGAGLIITPKDKRIITYDRIDISDVKFVGGAEEREIILLGPPRANEEGGMVGNQQLLSYMISKNQPDNFIKVNDLGVKEELSKLDIGQTGPADITQANVAAYMSKYSEGFGHNAKGVQNLTNSFRITNSEKSIGYKAKDVDSPYGEGIAQYKHPQILEMKGTTGKERFEPIYGHSRSLEIRELGDNDVQPSLKDEMMLLSGYARGKNLRYTMVRGNHVFAPLRRYRSDVEFYKKTNMLDPNKNVVITDSFSKKTYTFDESKDTALNNYGVEDKNLIRTYPTGDSASDIEFLQKKAYTFETDFKVLLNFRISLQKLRVLIESLRIPKYDSVMNPKIIKTDLNIGDDIRKQYAELKDNDFYSFQDILDIFKNDNLQKMTNFKYIENYIHNYTRAAIQNSLEPNINQAITPRSIQQGGEPMASSLGLHPIMEEKIYFSNPLSHNEIFNINAKLAKIEAQRAVLDNKQGVIDIEEEAGRLILEDEVSDAMINLIKHKDLGGEELFNLYKQARRDRTRQTMTTPGDLTAFDELRDKIQTAEKNWGSGKTIIRFAEEQYDTFKPSQFTDPEDMMFTMESIKFTGSTPVPPDKKGLSLASKAFANFINKPDQLVEMTTLFNLKKAIEGGFDKAQFNTFNTQSKLSGWIDFKGRPEDLDTYYMSPLGNADASDSALFKILNTQTDEGYIRELQQKASSHAATLVTERSFYSLKGIDDPSAAVKGYMRLNKKYDLDKKISNLLKDMPQKELNRIFLEGVFYLQDPYLISRMGLLEKSVIDDVVKKNTSTAGQVYKSNLNSDLQKLLKDNENLTKVLFSDNTNKLVMQEKEGKVAGIIRKIAEAGKISKEIPNSVWITALKEKIIDSYLMLPNTIDPMSYLPKVEANLFYQKYGMPTEEALTKGILGAKNEKGEVRYARLKDQYDKNKMKTLEKLGLNYKIVKDGKPNSPMTFIEVNLGNTKKEKLELLEKLNNYEVKLYSSMNPIPSFNEVKEEENEDPMALEST